MVTPYTPAGVGARGMMQGAQGVRQKQRMEEQARAQQVAEERARQAMEMEREQAALANERAQEQMELQKRKQAAAVMERALPLLQGSPEEVDLGRMLLNLGGISTMQGQDYQPREDTGGMDQGTDAAVADALMAHDAARGVEGDAPPGEGPVPASVMPPHMRQPGAAMPPPEQEPRKRDPHISAADEAAVEAGKEPIVSMGPGGEMRVRDDLSYDEDATQVQMDAETVEGQAPEADMTFAEQEAYPEDQARVSTSRPRAEASQQQGQQRSPLRFMFGGEPLQGSYDPGAQRDYKKQALFDFFDNMIETSDLRDRPAAEQARALAEAAIRVTGMEPQEALELVQQHRQERLGRESALQRKRIGAQAARDAGGVPGSDVRLWEKQAMDLVRKESNDAGYKEGTEALNVAQKIKGTIERAEDLPPEQAGALLRTAESYLIQLQQGGGRLSDTDVRLGSTIQSLLGKVRNAADQAVKGTFSAKKIRSMYQSVDQLEKAAQHQIDFAKERAAEVPKQYRKRGRGLAAEAAQQAVEQRFPSLRDDGGEAGDEGGDAGALKKLNDRLGQMLGVEE